VEVNAVKKLLCSCLLTWICLPSLGQTPSSLAALNPTAKNEAASSTAALPSQPREVAVSRATPAQRYVCNTGFTKKQCEEGMSVLRKAIGNYPVAELGEWTWILVRSQDWKDILLVRGLDPDSPAFTYHEKRQTFIEEALVMPAPIRARELLLTWHMKMSDLLDLAVRHELGHALCKEANEQNADRVARLLKRGKTIGRACP